MKNLTFHVNAFIDRLFAGNPAAVCVLPEWIAEDDLKNIAIENNLPVTAFIVQRDKQFEIRWITPELELDLCGHGTLSAAYIIFNELAPTLQTISFSSKAGLLQVNRAGEFIELNFPIKTIESCLIPTALVQGLGLTPKEVYQHKTERYMVVVETEEQVNNLKLDIQLLKKLEHRGIIITAPGSQVDFVSRTFYPRKMIPEDAVTGASHCLLAPYWAKRLKKNLLEARQLSARGGFLKCKVQHDNVLIAGKAVLYMKGEIVETL
jgi:PhzF family phenazine biosynthesis protein